MTYFAEVCVVSDPVALTISTTTLPSWTVNLVGLLKLSSVGETTGDRPNGTPNIAFGINQNEYSIILLNNSRSSIVIPEMGRNIFLNS